MTRSIITKGKKIRFRGKDKFFVYREFEVEEEKG
jgi:hypothetical protein